ncbi:MAG TPA: DUF480 domain-containing protein [Acidimicrobiales bacterium]|nr:DUF480 domain-containing protein [Acidimicrobiales bacterium]
MELTPEAGRVLGCLVEKQLTTPQAYPMTENALLAACNQTTSRDPVVQYDVATVRLAVRELRQLDLLRTVHRPGERSEKHRHQLEESAGLSTAEQVLLALLLLRGPQTAAELRARAERRHAFGAGAEVEATLRALGERQEPLVELLARQPGQKEARYTDAVVATSPAPTLRLVADVEPTEDAPPLDVAQELSALREEVAQLRAEVAELRARS